MKIVRVIDRIRKKYPDIKWSYSHAAAHWAGSDGSYIDSRCTCFDDEKCSCSKQYYRYFSDGTPTEWVRY